MPTRDSVVPERLRSDAATLERLGVADLIQRFEAWVAQGHPRDVDRFLGSLRRDGVLSVRHLCEVHNARPVRVALTSRLSDREPLERRYEVLAELGRGGMGVVLLARDRELQRTVALKVLADGVGPALRERFIGEACIAAQLDHPNIISVHALERTSDGHPAFTMEVVNGRTLQDILWDARVKLREHKGLTPDETLAGRLEIFAKVCEGVAYAHERGVVHRDLKPENLMVGAFGEVTVMDWGIAEILHEQGGQASDDGGRSTIVGAHEEGIAVGTPPYMSPEQARGEPLTPRSDQYSLGLILQEIVTLERAMPEGTVVETVLRAMEGERQPVRHVHGRRVHPDLIAIIGKATALEPARRYPSVLDLAADVRRAMQGEPPVARPDNLPRMLYRWGSRHTGLLATSLLIALLAAITFFGVGLAATGGIFAWAVAEHARVAALTAEVVGHSHAIDVEFLRVEAALEQVAGTAEQLWSYAGPQPGPIYRRADFLGDEPPEDYGPAPSYGRPMSFADPLALIPPGVDFEGPVEGEVRRLRPLRRTFRQVMLNGHGLEIVSAPPEVQERTLRESRGVVLWLYLGLESGPLINYPGFPDLSADYDPRRRPWYRATRGTRGARWGELYQDDSGLSILLPCNRAMYGPGGTFFGVAGADMALDTVVDLLDMPIASEAWLVDGQGRVVVGTADRGRNLGAGLHGDESLGTVPFAVPEIVDRIRADEAMGLLDVGGERYIWSRLTALPWTYIVRIDPYAAW